MKVLSLFDGISVARLAFERAKIPLENYFASEIDEYAKRIAGKNYPDTFQLGSVTDIFGDKKTETPQYIFVNRESLDESLYRRH